MAFQINGLGGIGPVPLAPASPAQTGGGAEGASFADLLEGLGNQSSNADAAMNDLAIGGEQDLHDVVLAVEMESMAFELAVEIRNRLVDAYSEIFRMTV